MGSRIVHARVRFYAELNDFLPAGRAGREIDCVVAERTSVKDLIERSGVPHTEVDLVLVDGEPVGFGHLLTADSRVAVFPAFRSLDISSVSNVRPDPLEEPRFVADSHLDKLVPRLRLLGLDTIYRNDADDGWLATVSAEDQRILLTRDRLLLKRSKVQRGYCVRSDDPNAQLAEVVGRFALAGSARPFTRCLRCNGVLHEVAMEAVLERLEPKTRLYYDDFRRCDACDQVYWKGSHFEPLAAMVAESLQPSESGRQGQQLPKQARGRPSGGPIDDDRP